MNGPSSDGTVITELWPKCPRFVNPSCRIAITNPSDQSRSATWQMIPVIEAPGLSRRSWLKVCTLRTSRQVEGPDR